MTQQVEDKAIITTFSGAHVDLTEPDPELIRIDDICHALAQTNRFTGHTLRPYTVAEHLLLGLEFCQPWHRFKWFTHDFSEAYLGDVSGPTKRLFGMEFYRRLEVKWELAIAERFRIPKAGLAEVKVLDQRMLRTEQRDLMGRQPLSTDKHSAFAMRLPPTPTSPAQLKQQMLDAFYALAGQTEGVRR